MHIDSEWNIDQNCWGAASQTALFPAPEDGGIWAISGSSHCCRGRTAPSTPCSWINAHVSACICHFPSTPIVTASLRPLIVKRGTLIPLTAFSSIYSHHTRWLTVSLLSCPQRHKDLLHNYHSQSRASETALWLAEKRDLLWYTSQSEETSLSIHKTLHHQVSWMIKGLTVHLQWAKGLQTRRVGQIGIINKS